MNIEDIQYLIPANILTEFENDTDAFDSLVSASNLLIKNYSGLDYEPYMLNEFIDVFLKLCVRKFESITKEQAELFERNYSLAIDTILKYKLKNCIVSEVINATV